jgi:poly(hydroxyalkanoate) granule-associated protein
MNQAANKSEQDKIKAAEKAGEMAKKIWLAGLGAYGKAFDGASEQLDKINEQYEKMSKETSEFFDDLVAKGKKLDSENHDKLSEAKEKTTSTIEERIAKVRSSFSFGGNADVAELTAKVDALAAKVDALLEANGVTAPKAKKVSKKSAAAA